MDGERQVFVLRQFELGLQMDYDGDGRADLAVYHQAAGDWYIIESTTGT